MVGPLFIERWSLYTGENTWLEHFGTYAQVTLIEIREVVLIKGDLFRQVLLSALHACTCIFVQKLDYSLLNE